jgi:hypothetical protein
MLECGECDGDGEVEVQGSVEPRAMCGGIGEYAPLDEVRVLAALSSALAVEVGR